MRSAEAAIMMRHAVLGRLRIDDDDYRSAEAAGYFEHCENVRDRVKALLRFKIDQIDNESIVGGGD